jgi:hypothetical protein
LLLRSRGLRLRFLWLLRLRLRLRLRVWLRLRLRVRLRVVELRLLGLRLRLRLPVAKLGLRLLLRLLLLLLLRLRLSLSCRFVRCFFSRFLFLVPPIFQIIFQDRLSSFHQVTWLGFVCACVRLHNWGEEGIFPGAVQCNDEGPVVRGGDIPSRIDMHVLQAYPL